MDETILFPSPNWFQVSGFVVSSDRWIVYGGPSKSLCVLEPLGTHYNGVVDSQQRYQAHVLQRAHPEKIVSVDISPEWTTKKCFLTGSSDGSVKQWNVDTVDERTVTIKTIHSHEIHSNEKEEIAGVGYSSEKIAITVGGNGNITKWDLNCNVVQKYNYLMKSFKPTCMSCSPHIQLNFAVGTKQGVVFVLDLNGSGKILYKVRGHDDEVLNVSWCPQFNVMVNKKVSQKRTNASDHLKKIQTNKKNVDCLEESGVSKNLPEDSFDESIQQEDDYFDIYKDHEVEEFGHKKYEPEDILVRVKNDDEEEVDYLTECLKLKEKILKRKDNIEPTIESLVDEIDKMNVNNTKEVTGESSKLEDSEQQSENKADEIDEDNAMQKHLLATVGKFGGVCVWSKAGKLVSNCAVPHYSAKTQRVKSPAWATLLWYKADCILIGDGRSQLLECNPLKIDCKNKLEWHVLHNLHKRGMYCIASNAPRVQTSELPTEDWLIWTSSQDRNVICYSLAEKKAIAVHNTCGGFIYNVQTCPYDAGKLAISVGDGAVRVWESHTLEENDTKLSPGNVHTYWQNVQGKVLTVAWHPTKENLLAFGTAESRVGIIDTSGKNEKPARVLVSGLHSGVYSLCWGPSGQLYACGGGELLRYNVAHTDQAPIPVNVEVEGARWELNVVRCVGDTWLVCGSGGGGVCVLDAQTRTLVAATFVFTKMLYSIEWHPSETSHGSGESPYKNHLAVCSLDKHNNIVILKFTDKEDGTKQLETYQTLSGHKSHTVELNWNPHHDGLLLSASQDTTIRIWDISKGECMSIYSGHSHSALTATWSAFPQMSRKVISGGGDCCLRCWDIDDHPAELYDDDQHEMSKKDKKKLRIKNAVKEKSKLEEQAEREEETNSEFSAARVGKIDKSKVSKKFLLSLTNKQMSSKSIYSLRKLLQKYLEKNSVDNVVETNGEASANKEEDSKNSKEIDVDYIKMFGTINEVNELLDLEMKRHLINGNTESWLMLMVFRGQIDDMIQYASQHNLLSPYLLSIAPCVSNKYWKDATQLYIAQIDRLAAKGEEEKLYASYKYGGAIYRKVMALLSLHDVKGAVATLIANNLFKEAYVLCRTRHMDSVAEETLVQWARDSYKTGKWTISAICYLALGNLTQAATVLGKSPDQHCLSFAAELAKIAGHTKFADHVEKKAQSHNIKTDIDQELDTLPSRIELLMNEEKNAEQIVASEVKVGTVTNDQKGVSLIKDEQEQASVIKNGTTAENGQDGALVVKDIS